MPCTPHDVRAYNINEKRHLPASSLTWPISRVIPFLMALMLLLGYLLIPTSPPPKLFIGLLPQDPFPERFRFLAAEPPPPPATAVAPSVVFPPPPPSAFHPSSVPVLLLSGLYPRGTREVLSSMDIAFLPELFEINYLAKGFRPDNPRSCMHF